MLITLKAVYITMDIRLSIPDLKHRYGVVKSFSLLRYGAWPDARPPGLAPCFVEKIFYLAIG